jgi:hypothetical protein
LDLWDAIKDSRSIDLFEDYIRRYPQGQYCILQRQRLGFIRILEKAGRKRGTLSPF